MSSHPKLNPVEQEDEEEDVLGDSQAPEEAESSSVLSSVEDDDDNGGDDDSGAVAPHLSIHSMEEATAVRQAALALYNKGEYEEAMKLQYRLVRYIIKAHKGAVTDPRNGLYFLDYGLSQLRLLQSTSGVDDILSPEKREEAEQDMEACFINLDVARVCFQKQLEALEDEAEEDDENENENENEEGKHAQGNGNAPSTTTSKEAKRVQLELTVAEVHNALAQLLMERGDYNAALREYDAELLIYRCLEDEDEDEDEREGGADNNHNNTDQQKKAKKTSPEDFIVPPGRMVACLYGAADCFLKEADFEGAEERLQATLDLIHRRYPPPLIDPALVEELEDWLADAKEMKGGAFESMQAAIQRQFAREEMDNMLEQTTATEEVAEAAEKTGKDTKKTSEQRLQPPGMPQKTTHPFISALPLNEASSSSPWSFPVAASSPGSGDVVLGGASGERSQSISLFPSQNMNPGPDGGSTMGSASASVSQSELQTRTSSSASVVVHSAVVTKKPKRKPSDHATAAAASGGADDAASAEAKRRRTE